MNFNEFCDSEVNNSEKFKNERLEKFNKNLQKNNKNPRKSEQINENLQNFYINKDISYDKVNANFDEKDIKQKIEKYQNMNQNELMAELIKESNKQKQNGNLDNKKLEEIKNSMSGFMTAEQQARLDELIKMLR